MDDVLIGNVQGRGDWDNATDRLNVNLDVARDDAAGAGRNRLPRPRLRNPAAST